VILNTIREINAGFEKIEAAERVPLPDRPGIDVDYLYLLRLERRAFISLSRVMGFSTV
jgi:hypothetical protein